MKVIRKSLGLKFERLLRLRTAEVYYADAPRLDTDEFDVLRFTQCGTRGGCAGLDFHTLLVDLTRDEDAIFGDFNATTQYEIRRCMKGDPLLFSVESAPGAGDIADFIRLYRLFCEEKGYADPPAQCRFYLETLTGFMHHGGLVITKGVAEDGTELCVHTYLVDGVRARLINSASLFRDAEPSFRALVGRANRCLHWKDMLHFKEQGYRSYDMGGIDADHPVSKFKRSFGGDEVTEFHEVYRPVTLRGRLALWLQPADVRLRNGAGLRRRGTGSSS